MSRKAIAMKTIFRRLLWPASLLLLASTLLAQTPPSNTAAQGPLELTSRLGRNLYALPDDQAVTDARKNLAAAPKNPDLALKLSLALAGRRQYKEAVAVVTRVLAFAPQNPALYLERGHRELGLRQFAAARTDLEHATRLAPELLQAHYHLGLAHYFLEDFEGAAASFTRARDLATTDDDLIDCTNWLYVSLRRAGKTQDAANALARITPQTKNTEAHLYFYLQLLHFYQGKLTADAILPHPPASPSDLEGELSYDTVNYGVGNWYLYNGDRSRALPLFRNVVRGQAWNAWGFIGSELALARSPK